MALKINDENAKELIASGKPVVIDFWAEWCGPCRAIAPSVDELAEEYEGKVIIGKYNVDDDTDLSAEYSIRNIPTWLFFKEGIGIIPETGVNLGGVAVTQLPTQQSAFHQTTSV